MDLRLSVEVRPTSPDVRSENEVCPPNTRGSPGSSSYGSNSKIQETPQRMQSPPHAYISFLGRMLSNLIQ